MSARSIEELQNSKKDELILDKGAAEGSNKEQSVEKENKLEETNTTQMGVSAEKTSKKGENAKEERNEIERIFKQIILEGTPPREFKIKLLKVLQTLVNFIFLIQKDSIIYNDKTKQSHTLNSTISEGSEENRNGES